MTTEIIDRQVLKYNGSKKRIYQWVKNFEPDHITYASVYGGGASEMFVREKSKYEVYNDIDGNVVNLFTQLRDNPRQLIRAIKLTPYSRVEFEKSKELEDCTSPLERARLFYVRCWMGRGVNVKIPGFRKVVNQTVGGHHPARLFAQIRHLYKAAARFRGIVIEQLDAIDLIQQYDSVDTYFYLDPTYLPETRNNKNLYEYEMAADDHIELAKTLNNIKGMAIISGYESDLYRELFTDRGWSIRRKDQNTHTGEKKIECIWINPAAIKRQKQMELFL